MKRLGLLGMLLIGAVGAHAESVLIVHAQVVPAALEGSFRSTLGTQLLERTFSQLFNQGDIAFDTKGPATGPAPAPTELRALAERYGADRVVYFRAIWKTADPRQAALELIEYQVVTSNGQTEAQGSITVELRSPSADEARQIRTAVDRFLAAIRPQ